MHKRPQSAVSKSSWNKDAASNSLAELGCDTYTGERTSTKSSATQLQRLKQTCGTVGGGLAPDPDEHCNGSSPAAAGFHHLGKIDSGSISEITSFSI
jgi:hypothetical protein